MIYILAAFFTVYATIEGVREGIHYRFKKAVKHALVESDKNLKFINAITFLLTTAAVTYLAGEVWGIIPYALVARKVLLDGVQNKMISPYMSFWRVSASGRAATDNIMRWIAAHVKPLSVAVQKIILIVLSILFAIFTG